MILKYSNSENTNAEHLYFFQWRFVHCPKTKCSTLVAARYQNI